MRSKNNNKDKLFYQINLNKYDKKQSIKWEIDKDLLEIMKESHIGKKYESDVFNDIWAIGCCPNGPDMDDKGIVFIYLNLCGLPQNISKIKVKWRVRIIETGTVDNNIDDFDYNNYGWEWSTKQLMFNEFKKYSTFTIIIDIMIIKEIDNDGDEIMISTMNDVVNEWTKFVENTNNDRLERELNQYKAKVGVLEHDILNMNLKMDKMMNTINELTSVITKQQQILNNNNNNNNNGIVKHNGNTQRDKVYIWLRDVVNLEEYYNLFTENGFDDMEIIKNVTNQHLMEIGIHKIGHRIKIIKHISLLNNT